MKVLSIILNYRNPLWNYFLNYVFKLKIIWQFDIFIGIKIYFLINTKHLNSKIVLILNHATCYES